MLKPLRLMLLPIVLLFMADVIANVCVADVINHKLQHEEKFVNG